MQALTASSKDRPGKVSRYSGLDALLCGQLIVIRYWAASIGTPRQLVTQHFIRLRFGEMIQTYCLDYDVVVFGVWPSDEFID